jgi:hypothetical protein
VVVVAVDGGPALARCLAALAGQRDPPPFEILLPGVPVPEGPPARAGPGPAVRAFPAAGRRTPAALRALGVGQARGAVVALTEDHCVPAPDWCARVVSAHRAPPAAIGGVVEKVSGASLGWAIYFCDYGRYMPPAAAGPVAGLTDINVAYKRAALAAIEPVWREEFHEPVVHQALRARGERLWLDPTMLVRQHREPRWAAALRERAGSGRLYAATRPEARSRAGRARAALFAAVQPPLVVARVVRDVLRRGRRRGELVRALPALVAVTAAWAAGELVGYAAGRAPAGPEP